jgi:hypothetical protein
MRVESGADGRAAKRQLVHRWQRRFHRAHRHVELRHPAGNLLAERQRRGVLQMRASDFHNVHERTSFRVQRAAQRGHRRTKVMDDLLGGRRCASPSGNVSLDDWPRLT